MAHFRGTIAEHYADTRFIPLDVCRSLIRHAVEHASLHRPMRVFADIGCGSGRLLRGFQSLQTAYKCVAFDISPDMLHRIPFSLLCRGNISAVERDCSSVDALPSSCFDLIVLHWVVNVSPRWSEVLQNCVMALRPGGSLLWFDERGDLYDAVDGSPEGFLETGSEFSFALWNRFYRELGRWGEQYLLALRTGVAVKSTTQEKFLFDRGLEIRYLTSTSRTWRKEIRVRWLIKRVMEERAFSNFWRIPDSHYERALDKVKAWVSTYPTACTLPMTMRYRSTPILAIRKH